MYTSKIEDILFHVDDAGIAHVTLNREPFSNAFTWDMMREITAIMEYCAQAEEVRTVVLSGAGSHFCAGGDIKRFKSLIDAGTGLPEEGIVLTGKMAQSVRLCDKPVIAKVNGFAVGAGSALALACDFRVMSASSKLVGAFVKMGFSGDTCGWYYMSRLIGMAKTNEFYMLGVPMTGEDAFALGIANRYTKDNELDSVAMELAAALANSATTAIAYQKKMMNLIAYPDLSVLMELERNYMPTCSLTDDHKEAVHAFLEKRPPKFTGK